MRWYNYISFVLLAVLSFSGCQNNLIDVDPPVAGTVNSYAWKTNTSLQYTIEANSVTSFATLQFTKSGSANQYLVNQSINGNALTMQLLSASDTMSISGLSPLSVIPIPTNLSMTDTKFDTLLMFPNIKHVFGFGNSAFASDSVSAYFSRGDGWFRASSIAEPIIAFSRLGAYGLGITASGNILLSIDTGASWSLNSNVIKRNWTGAITAFYSDGFNFYFAVEKSEIFRISNGTILDETKGANFPSPVTSIGWFTPSGTDSLLVVGTHGSGLFYVNDSQTVSPFIGWSHPNDNIFFVNTSKPKSMLIGASSGLYASTRIDSFTRISDKHFVKAVYYESQSKYVLIDDLDSVYTLSQNQVTPLATLPGAHWQDITAVKGKIILGSDAGIYSATDAGGSWAHDVTLADSKVSTVKTPRFMYLLTGTLDTGKTWDAGTMTFEDKPVMISARVADYFDSVKLTNGITFTSVFTVTYTLKDIAGNSRDSFPQWTIYYAKGEGPILIDERLQGKLNSRSYRTTR